MEEPVKNNTTPAIDYLVNVLVSIDNKDDCLAFLEDLCTINEITSLSQRLEVAKMLRQDKTYNEIAQTTGASTATISRVKRSLNYGNESFDKIFSKEQ